MGGNGKPDPEGVRSADTFGVGVSCVMAAQVKEKEVKKTRGES
jgi:hypothetical protein